MDWHEKSAEEVLKELATDPSAGLSTAEALLRLEKYGENALKAGKRESRILKFLKQFTEFIILVLIGAAVIAGVLGEWVDSLAIVAIVAMNGVIGFLQEEKAARVLETLKKLSAPVAKVLRDSSVSVMDSRLLVPGDIVMLEGGDNVPADCRVIESMPLRVNEAALTGESAPVDKETGGLEDKLPLADRINMAYMGTNVVYGRGKGVVVSTGMRTEMGNIARLLEEVRTEPTPLQKRLAEFGALLVYGAGGICALIFVIGVLRGEDWLEMFLTAVSLAVAAIPEGLPAVVTVTLALGVQRMVKRHSLIRKLPSVETLGSATVIATDKTGTITENQMTVRKVFLMREGTLAVTGAGYSPSGSFFAGSREIKAGESPALMQTIRAGMLCNSSEVKGSLEGGWQVIGDPTEGALLVMGMKAGIDRGGFLKRFSLVAEVPFDSERKMMTAVYRGEDAFYLFVKGAPERILPVCAYALDGDRERPMTAEDLKNILAANDSFSGEAHRVLALSYRRSSVPFDIKSLHLLEKDLVFTGLAAMIDPPREEVFGAVARARSAGITTVMITGDHRLTAVAVAKETGIFIEGDLAMTGDELERMDEEEFQRLLPRIKVYARVNPEHKLKIVKAWRRRKDTIAMTGDGVNDAPALKEADIGVAMGISGTDVTKEASDMVLTDDNFSSIVAAVEEGRGIFDNIRKVVHFLLSCNLGEVFVLFAASIAGMPLPLLPVQILWTNLVTDGLPALGLAMEDVDRGLMDRPPRRKDEGIVTRPLFLVMLLQGSFIAFCTLLVYALELYYFGSDLMKARTMAFSVLVLCQKFHVFNCRSMRVSVFKTGLFTNTTLNISVAVILLSQAALIYIPSISRIFKVAPLTLMDWALVFAASIQPLVFMEIAKMIWKGRRGHPPVNPSAP